MEEVLHPKLHLHGLQHIHCHVLAPLPGDWVSSYILCRQRVFLTPRQTLFPQGIQPGLALGSLQGISPIRAGWMENHRIIKVGKDL